MEHVLRIRIRSHHFLVDRISHRAREAVTNFSRQLQQFAMFKERGRWVTKPTRVFAAATSSRNEYRFHINCLSGFKDQLKLHFIKDEMVEWITEPFYPVDTVELPIVAGLSPFDYQVPAIECIKSPEPPRAKFLAIQTGKGKSFCTMKAISDLGLRAAYFLRPMFIEKWIIDIQKTYDISAEDIMVVQGGKQLMALTHLAVNGLLDSKVLLFSNKTYQIWLKEYETYGQNILEKGYACTPDELWEHMRVGVRVIDEVHLDFHLNFKLDLYTHCERSISLSASFVSDDSFLNRMYELTYPANSRYNGGEYHKYISGEAVFYNLLSSDKIRTTNRGDTRYNHNVFEQSILHSVKMKQNYFSLVYLKLKESYLVRFKEGRKAIIFCASKDMCGELVQFLRHVCPGKTVERYVDEDPYENLMDPDIRVTTLNSAGTAVDIPGLITTILTVAVRSSQSNIQGLGRLRETKDGTVPEFLYFVCEDLPKHVEYHNQKKELLESRTINYKIDRTGFLV